jgi:DNA-binding NarL/FixJ family response regulator
MRRPVGVARLGRVIRCLIADDNASFLEAATSVLERGGATVAGTARTIAEALQCAHALEPDVVLVDIGLGSESGLDLVRRLAAAGSSATLILISTQAEADFADLIAATPAAGFVPKSELSAAAIRRLLGVLPG